ncbi:sensor histidine kinase [Brachybacterium sp. GCM10030252]
MFDVDSPRWLGAQALLVLTAAVWSGVWVFSRAGRPRSPYEVAVHYLVRTILAFVLAWINPFFGIYAWVGYLDLGELTHRRHRRLGLLAVAVTVAGSQSGGLPPEGTVQWLAFAALLAVNLGLVPMLDHMHAQNTRQAVEQISMIAELEQVNADLKRAAQENTKLQETVVTQARLAGVHEERERLAREIHDTLAQSLAATLTQLQAAEREPDPRPRLARAIGLVRTALGEARRSVLNLAPESLDTSTLPEAVGELIDQWTQDYPCRAEFVITGEVRPLHPEVEATVLRVVQESLSNVRKHADASRVVVTLTFDDEQMVLDVRDDGRGFDPDIAVGGTSFGLRGMRQRATRLAGKVDVESRPGQGTAVSLRLPALPREAAA